MVAAMAAIIFVPIPFGNIVPASVLLLLGLGLVFEDGLALLAGAAIGVVLVIVLVGLMVSGVQWLPALFAGLSI
jgi:hypothetical protein